MDEEYRIEYVDKPEESAWGIIGRGVSTYNIQQTGDDKFQRLCFVLQTPDQEIVGGVLGEIYWDWIHIDLLWVKDGNYFNKKMNWQTAKRACESLDLAGLAGWRLPTKRELESLVNKDYDPAINPIFGCEPSCYWTSSPSARGGSSLECVLFTYGRISYNINSYLHVRCVRGGQ